MSKKRINVAIIGSTGFTGLDLVFLLSKHSKVKILYLCATKNLGKKISFFDKRIKKKLPLISGVNNINWHRVDLAFLSLPNGQAQKIISKNFNKFKKVKFIDLSADFRLSNLHTYKKNYGLAHSSPMLMKESIYSISEITRKDVKNYRIISNPGCYPTSIQLPLIPLIQKGLIKTNDITIDSKSGYSGAGKSFLKKFTHKNFFKSTFAYAINNHRHIAEIDQELKKHTNKKIKFTFNPHLLPTFRGILSSIYVEIRKGSSISKIHKALKIYYKKNKFVKILKINSAIGSGDVLNTNNCIISICKTRLHNKLVIFSAIDNLVKGASGQAIQNMNLIYDFPEHLGLK